MRTMAMMFRLLMLAVLAMLSLTSIPQAHAHFVSIDQLMEIGFGPIEPHVRQYLEDWKEEREREDRRPRSLRRFTAAWAKEHAEDWGKIVKAKGIQYVKGAAAEWLKQTRSKTGPFKKILNGATPIVKAAIDEFKKAKQNDSNLKLVDFVKSYGVKAGKEVVRKLATQGGNWCVNAAVQWIEASENKLIKQVAGKAGDFIEEFVKAAKDKNIDIKKPKELLKFAKKYMSDPDNISKWQLALISMGKNQLEKRAKGLFGRFKFRKVSAEKITEDSIIDAFDEEKDFKLVDEEEENEGLASMDKINESTGKVDADAESESDE